MKNTFIFKSDLAQAFFPWTSKDSARHKFIALINSDDTLIADLTDAGYKPDNRSFSPRQVEIITNRLGNPWKSN